jgi:hypothetical protein
VGDYEAEHHESKTKGQFLRRDCEVQVGKGTRRGLPHAFRPFDSLHPYMPLQSVFFVLIVPELKW